MSIWQRNFKIQSQNGNEIQIIGDNLAAEHYKTHRKTNPHFYNIDGSFLCSKFTGEYEIPSNGMWKIGLILKSTFFYKHEVVFIEKGEFKKLVKQSDKRIAKEDE